MVSTLLTNPPPAFSREASILVWFALHFSIACRKERGSDPALPSRAEGGWPLGDAPNRGPKNDWSPSGFPLSTNQQGIHELRTSHNCKWGTAFAARLPIPIQDCRSPELDAKHRHNATSPKKHGRRRASKRQTGPSAHPLPVGLFEPPHAGLLGDLTRRLGPRLLQVLSCLDAGLVVGLEMEAWETIQNPVGKSKPPRPRKPFVTEALSFALVFPDANN